MEKEKRKLIVKIQRGSFAEAEEGEEGPARGLMLSAEKRQTIYSRFVVDVYLYICCFIPFLRLLGGSRLGLVYIYH